MAKTSGALRVEPESLEDFETRTVPDNRNAEARQRLNELTDRLALIADWKDQLHAELKRNELLLELGLLDEQRLKALMKRVRFFSEACNALGDTLGGRE